MANDLSVLLVTPVYPPPPGGIQTLVKNLEQGLEATGTIVDVLHSPPEDYKGYLLRDFIPRNRSLETLLSHSPYLYPYFNRMYRESNEKIADFDPDIIHSLHVRGWPAILAGNEQNTPTVVSAHAAELANKTESMSAFEKADAIHAVSEYTKSRVEDDYHVPVTKVIHPSINLDDYSQSTGRDTKSKGDVFVISRLVSRKNISTIIDAWGMLDEETKKGRCLKIAGTGPLEAYLTDCAKTVDGVELIGRISEVKKREYLYDSKLFVLPASGEGYDVEGFGIVYLEAQAAGTPVIGSGRGGAPEAIGDGGFILENEQSSEELATEMERLLTESQIYREYVNNAQERIEEFSATTIAEEYLELYESLL